MSATKLQTRGFTNGWSAVFVVAAVVLSAGGAVAQVPQLAIGNASGAPDGQATVTVSLSNAGESAATAQLDVLFDEAVLSIADPVSACVKDPRLTAQVLNASLPGAPPAPEGQKRLRLAILDIMPPIESLSDGNLVTCTFDIAADAPLGDVTLTADRLQVAATNGATVLCGPGSDPVVDCEGMNGVVSVAFPADTPTETATEVPPTSTRTPTLTPVPPTQTLTPVPPTATHTTAPTATRTTAASPTKTQGSSGGGGGGCSIAPTGESSPAGILFLLGGSLLLVWARRRHR
jgi:MYXO-CTERM domain-containing protein